MAVRDIEREVAALSELRFCADFEARSRQLRKALTDKVNVVVARAALASAEIGQRAIIPDLCRAFERLLVNPSKTDPKCWGKHAIAKALVDLCHSESEIFRKGARHVQMEPVWGGQEDTATHLRGTCLFALLSCLDLTRQEKLWAVLPFLTEPSPSLRKDGVSALQTLGGTEAALLLALKASMGDAESAVTGNVLESLLRTDGEQVVPFAAGFLAAPSSEVREEAALALGSCRLPGAVHVLAGALTNAPLLVPRQVVYRALGISRTPEATAVLLEALRASSLADSLAALDALGLCGDSAETRQEIQRIVDGRTETQLQEQWKRLTASFKKNTDGEEALAGPA